MRFWATALAGASRPLKLGLRRVVIGAQLRDVTGGDGAVIDEIFPGMPAERAGLKAGDVIVECDNIPLTARQALTDALFGRDPGEKVKMMAKRGERLEEIHVTPASPTTPLPPTPRPPADRNWAAGCLFSCRISAAMPTDGSALPLGINIFDHRSLFPPIAPRLHGAQTVAALFCRLPAIPHPRHYGISRGILNR